MMESQLTKINSERYSAPYLERYKAANPSNAEKCRGIYSGVDFVIKMNNFCDEEWFLDIKMFLTVKGA